jgi:membrane protein implicated in regulation of membrane protease activity
MLATDPLSLVFVGCIVFAGAFLVLSSVLGIGHGHTLHLGHAGHVAHVGHAAHTGHVAHPAHGAHPTGSHATTHGAPHGQPGSTNGDAGAAPMSISPLQGLSTTLLGALNLYGLLMFLLVFGLLGYILHNAAHTAALLAIFVPLFFAAFAAVGSSALLRRFFEDDDSGELTIDNSQIEGQLGLVTMSIRAGGVGEVVFTSNNRGRQSVSARSADGQAIAAGSEVVILSFERGIARVQAWDRSTIGARASQLSAAPPGESNV